MTGNQYAPFFQTNQGPRGIPSVTGAPLVRRRRRALVDLDAYDRKVREENAKLQTVEPVQDIVAEVVAEIETPEIIPAARSSRGATQEEGTIDPKDLEGFDEAQAAMKSEDPEKPARKKARKAAKKSTTITIQT